MKIMLLGDTHIGARSDNQVVLDHFMSFYKNRFFPLLEEHKPDIVLQLGDLLDRRKFANFATLDRMRKDFLNPIVNDFKIPLWILVGNHDTYFRNTLEVNGISQSFSDLIAEGKIRLFDKPEETEAGLIIPWVCADNHDEAYKAVEASSSRFCFGHFELTGYDMYRGMPCEHGANPDFLGRFEQVYSGHFHTHSRKRNICYVGTPYDIIWSDASDSKYVMLLDTEADESFRETWFENESKLHHKVMVDSSKISRASLKDADYSHLKEKFVKLIILNSDRPDAIELISKAIRSVEPTSFTIVDSTSLNSTDEIQALDKISHKDPLTALLDEIDLKFGAGSPKANRLKGYANEIYTEALSGAFE